MGVCARVRVCVCVCAMSVHVAYLARGQWPAAPLQGAWSLTSRTRLGRASWHGRVTQLEPLAAACIASARYAIGFARYPGLRRFTDVSDNWAEGEGHVAQMCTHWPMRDRAP